MSTGARILAHLARNKSVSDAILTRQSVRKFLGIPVPKPVIQEIIQTASRAPSGGNLQPWKVYVLAGDKREELVQTVQKNIENGDISEEMDYEIYPAHLKEPYKARRSKVATDMYKLLNIERSDRESRLAHLKNNWNFFDAPVGLIFTIDRQMHQGQYVDLGMYMQNVMLLSREKGLHTCAQEAWAVWPKTIEKVLRIPSNEMVFAGMSVGYADHSDPVNRLKTDRAELSDFAVFHYDEHDEAEHQKEDDTENIAAKL